MQATLIKTSGETQVVTPKDGEAFDLDELQVHVGGYIEVVCCPNGKVLLVDEDGHAGGRSPNPVASEIRGIPIVGDVLCFDTYDEFQEAMGGEEE